MVFKGTPEFPQHNARPSISWLAVRWRLPGLFDVRCSAR